MEGCSPRQLPLGKRAFKMYVAVAFGVAVAVLVITLPTVLCQSPAGSTVVGSGLTGLALLEKELAVTNRTLAEARAQWDSCREQLGALEGKVSELDQALGRVTQLQEENRMLKTEVAQQQEQLGDLQSSRDNLQLQNQLLKKQLQDMRRQYSSGNKLPAMTLSLLALLLPGMFLL